MNSSFLSIEEIREVSLYTLNPTAYLQCAFRLSNRVNEYERVIYSIFDMAGDVGGFAEFIYIACLVVTSSYASRMFFGKVMSEMFRIRLDTRGPTIRELETAITIK